MTEQNKVKASLIGLDNLIEDLFGLNAKAFKSIWLSFKSPQAYTVAAADSSWLERFTPTVRVWFGLVAFYSALRFFYGGEDGAMTRIYAEMIETAMVENPDSPLANVDANLFAQSLLKWTFVFFPFIMLTLYACLAFVFRVWPDKPGFVVRFRYIMLTILPGTALTALITFTYIFLDSAMLAVISIINLIAILFLDGITAFRGSLHTVDHKSRLGLSIVLTILLFIVFMIGSTLAFIPAAFIATLELTPTS